VFPHGDDLTVVVPFNPRRHPAQMARACPQAWAAAESPARRAQLRDCFARWLQLRLDGQAVAASTPRYYTDPHAGQQAIATVVPIRGLPAGEHELRIALAPNTSGFAEAEPAEYRIAFWRQEKEKGNRESGMGNQGGTLLIRFPIPDSRFPF
jgi:hypothetical protein